MSITIGRIDYGQRTCSAKCYVTDYPSILVQAVLDGDRAVVVAIQTLLDTDNSVTLDR